MAALAVSKSSRKFLSVARVCFASRLPKTTFSFHFDAKVLNRGSFFKPNFTRALFQSNRVFAEEPDRSGETPAFVHPHARTIFVGKLCPSTTQKSVEDYFCQFGVLEEVYLKVSTKKYDLRSCAFVQFKDLSSLEKIFDPNLKHVIDSRNIHLEKYKALDSRKIYVSNVPLEFDESELKEHFSQFGNVDMVQFVSRNPLVGRESYCFVEFTNPSAVIKALALPLQQIGQHTVEVKKYYAKHKNYIKGKVIIEVMPDNMTVEGLRDYFSKFGELAYIDLTFYQKIGKGREIAFLSFSDDKTVEKVAERNGRHTLNNQEVVVKRASSNHITKDRDLKIFVDRIPAAVSKDLVRNYFKAFGNATLLTKWTSEDHIQSYIVMFSHVDEVDRVLAHCGHTLGGEKLIVKKIGWTAKPPKKKKETDLKELLSLL